MVKRIKAGFFISSLGILILLLLFPLSCEKPERLFKLATLDVVDSDVTYSLAVLRGEIIDVGSRSITDHGIVLSESGTPTVGISSGKPLGPVISKGVFSDTIKNLTKNTTYYFRAYVVVDGEERYAETTHFKTKDTQAPSVTAGSITGINMTSASLNGEVTSDGGEPQLKRGLCWGTSSNPTISSCVDTTVNGSGTGVFAGKMTGLTPGTQYYVRTYASNLKGVSYNSADILFKTHSLPVLTTTIVSGISNTGAVSGGNITDDGGSAILSRGVCWGTSTGPTIALTTKTSDAAGTGIFTSTLTGLIPLTTYYLRAYATNEYGTSYGNELTLTSTKAPVTVTNPATTILNTSAVLNGSVNANSFTSTVTFEYGLTTSYGSVINAIPGTVTGTSATSVQATINSLNPGLTYHFRVKAVNSGGTSFGQDLSFTTIEPPSVLTYSSINITATSATLTGRVGANNLSSTVTFEYGTTTSYGSSVTALESPVTGNASTEVTANISGLLPSTTYHFRAKAVNAAGTIYGDDLSFTTPVLPPPSVTTGSATTVSSTAAVLNGTVNANGYSSVVSFEYGTTASYGSTAIANESPVAGNTPTAVTANISGLTSSTTYHFRVKGVSTNGDAAGIDATFTTPSTITDYDGNIYNTIQIGTQIWMQENLKTTSFGNGDAIPNVTDNVIWNGLTTGAFTWYADDASSYKDSYGGLYNWYTTVDVRNICPSGWHVPSDPEWTILTTYLGGEVTAGGKLKEVGFNHWINPNTGATDESGFAALPGGIVSDSRSFGGMGMGGCWWSSTLYYTNLISWYRNIGNESGSIGRLAGFNQNNRFGYSIRCLKGEVPIAATCAASSLTSSSSILNGKVNPNGASTTVVFEYGISTSYGSEITADQSVVSGNLPVNVTASLTGLTLGTTYHYRIKAVNSFGTSYGSDMTFIYLYYGAIYQGGLVYYIDATGQHGMVCTETNQSAYVWGCSGTGTGALGTDVGTGNANTNAILAHCATSNIAAKICNDLVYNGFNDWALPSIGDLQSMYTNLKANGLGNFDNGNHCSSTEINADYFWSINFSSGSQFANWKTNNAWIRAVRAF